MEQRAYPLQAIGLATDALCRYAALTDHFTSKASLLSCLDLARTAPEIHDPWMVALGHDVQTLLAPAQAVPAPALFAYIDRTLTFDEELESGLYDRDS